jgi:xanthine dehydrogenase accessory factor
MREREQILDLWREMRGTASSGVLVTVVKTLGSSYRRPGARMLLTESAKRAGSISGGCLENDVMKKAWWLTEKGPVLRRYDTTPDGDIGPSGEPGGGFGLGCNGIIYLLLERVNSADGDTCPLALLQRVHATRQECLLATVLEPATNAGRRLVREAGQWLTCGVSVDEQMAARIQEAGRQLTSSSVERLESGEEVFFETLTAPIRLLICGAGDDAIPLTEMARHLGWQVSVFDGRAHYARREKFPLAQEVSVRASAAGLEDVRIDARTVAVVMTHSYSQDLNFLTALMRESPAYVGVLGPRSRSTQLLIDAGISAGSVPFLHGPVGLDIGADGPEQVALSIIAEIQASMNGRQGGPLRVQTGSIHSRESDGRATDRFLPSIACA